MQDPKKSAEPKPALSGIVTIHIRRIGSEKTEAPLRKSKATDSQCIKSSLREQVYPMVGPGNGSCGCSCPSSPSRTPCRRTSANKHPRAPPLSGKLHVVCTGPSSPQVFVMQAVPAQGVCRPFSTSAHVTV